jgi:hypothetical protein
MTRDRPEIERLSVTPRTDIYKTIDEELYMSYFNISDESTETVDKTIARMADMEKSSNDVEDEVAPLMTAKILGTFSDYFDMMMDKHITHCYHTKDDNQHVVILDSYGAEHSTIAGKWMNVVSYSSQVFSRNTVTTGVSTAESFNLLTCNRSVGRRRVRIYIRFL